MIVLPATEGSPVHRSHVAPVNGDVGGTGYVDVEYALNTTELIVEFDASTNLSASRTAPVPTSLRPNPNVVDPVAIELVFAPFAPLPTPVVMLLLSYSTASGASGCVIATAAATAALSADAASLDAAELNPLHGDPTTNAATAISAVVTNAARNDFFDLDMKISPPL